jgi:ATP adenylyltransferase
MRYIQQEDKSSDCVFCLAIQQQDGFENLVLHRASRSFVILNRYPYTTGHLMVVPNIHQPTLENLDPETRQEMMELVNLTMVVLRQVYHPDGFNIGANIGVAAGAGIASHVHLHVLPRWTGDTNFMSTIGGTRVLPEELSQTYQRVLSSWPG